MKLEHHWRQVPPLPLSPSSRAGGRDFSSGGRPPQLCSTALLLHYNLLPRSPSTAASTGTYCLQPGSDPRPTKMLTRALVRASRALPGILTRAYHI